MRDMMEELRSSGVDIGGPPALSQADRRAFASQLDAILARAARREIRRLIHARAYRAQAAQGVLARQLSVM